MSIDPSTLDPETVVEVRYLGPNHDLRWHSTASEAAERIGVDVTRVFEPVPNDDEALPPDQWDKIKRGTRVRVLFDEGHLFIGDRSRVSLRDQSVDRVWVLSEPVDPDAELLEKMAEAIRITDSPVEEWATHYARAALAVVRAEDGAK